MKFPGLLGLARLGCLSRRCILFLCVTSSSLASPADQLASAQATFTSASSASDFAKAAQAFERLAQEIPNPGLHFNAGNAFFRSGDLGRAILHYRRALRLSPSYDEAKANLAAARRKRLDQAEPPSPGVLERLAFWHSLLSARSKFWGFFMFWILLWSSLLLRLWRPLPHLRVLAACCLLPAALLAGSLAIEVWQEKYHPSAVVLASEVSLRIGGGERYDLAVKEPLHAGAELRVLEIRPGWFRVLLNSEISGWVPAEVLGLIPVGN